MYDLLRHRTAPASLKCRNGPVLSLAGEILISLLDTVFGQQKITGFERL